MRKRYTEEQIIKAIKDHETEAKVDDICRKLSISSGTFYNWRSKYAGLEVSGKAWLLTRSEPTAFIPRKSAGPHPQKKETAAAPGNR